TTWRHVPHLLTCLEDISGQFLRRSLLENRLSSPDTLTSYDRIIANSSRTSSFSNGTLDILVTVARDDGAYTCIAINAAGEATATVDLKITPLPHRGGAGGNTGNNNVNTKNNRNLTNGILRTDPGSSDISTGKNGGINNGVGRGGEVEDGRRGGGDGEEGDSGWASEGEKADGGSMEDDEGDVEEGRMVGVQGVTSTSAQVRWDLGRLSAAYVVWIYQIQYNCTADETLIYSGGILAGNQKQLDDVVVEKEVWATLLCLWCHDLDKENG
ncbi:leucine-rich repeat and fibronectin type-III domain-containing protein 4-like protein, partial [Lates japonicus]